MRLVGKVLSFFILCLLPIAIFFVSDAIAIDIGMPIDCNYGKDCFISNYFDHDDTDKVYKDHACGSMSQDAYKSTDFILKNFLQMQKGVNVVAADSGILRSVRNDIMDVNIEFSGLESVRGRECGNGVVIEHKNGYKTQYCHLKKGSITLKRGEKIEKGQNIGEVGLSGLTGFPYLEFTVFLNDKAIDPFTGQDLVTGKAEVACDRIDIDPLWDKKARKKLTYINTAILSSGFSSKVPSVYGAREGAYNIPTIPSDTKLLSLWVDVLGVMKGDKLKMSIISPDGEKIYSTTKSFHADKRHIFQFVGTKLKDDMKEWKTGEYIGSAVLIREGEYKTEKVFDSWVKVTVTSPTH